MYDPVSHTLARDQGQVNNLEGESQVTRLRDRTLHLRPIATFGILIAAAVGFHIPALAEDASQGVVEEIVVTGSLIRRDSYSSASPLTVVSLDDMRSQGVNTINDVMANMTFMGGIDLANSDIGQGEIIGAANVNLRNLGVQQTLVLLNGRREVFHAVIDNDGASFVNTNNLVPMIALERVETLLDGGSALYGTDAVAGVVNFITRDDFQGVEFQADYRTLESDSRDLDLQMIIGAGNDRGNVMLAAHYLDRTPLFNFERPFTRGLSSFGQPGSFRLLDGPQAGQIVPDPTCGDANQPNSLILPNGRCGFDFSPFWSLVADQKIVNLYSSGSYRLFESGDAFLDSLNVNFELGYVNNDTTRSGSPSRPISRLQTVPADHPGNVFGVDALFLGRAIGGAPPGGTITGLADGGTIEAGPKGFQFDTSTWRAGISLDGDLPGTETWTFDLSYKYSNSRQVDSGAEGLLEDEFQLALRGLGGFDCDPSTGTPGVGDCLYFNPFGNFKNVPRDDPRFNSQEIYDFIFSDQFAESERSLEVVDLVFSGDIFNLSSGPVGMALGMQYREDRASKLVDPAQVRGDFLLLQDNNFEGKRDAWGTFAEVLVPITQDAELDFQVRYEDLGEGVDTTDPKVSFRWEPMSGVALRASAGTSFRVGTLPQLQSRQDTAQNVVDPILGSQAFKIVTTLANPDLEPEESENFNIGFSIDGAQMNWLPGFNLSLDYWWYDFEGLISEESAGQVLAREAAGGLGSEPNVVRDPITGEIETVITERINAGSVKTDGLDLTGSYYWSVGDLGEMSISTNATYINKLDTRGGQTDPVRDSAGNRNSTTFLRAAPDLRANASWDWFFGAGSLRLTARYISDFEDDSPNRNRDTVPSYTTYDIQYTYQFDSLLGLESGPSATIGFINVTDEEPPQVATNFGFIPEVHDPRGRISYLRLRQSF